MSHTHGNTMEIAASALCWERQIRQRVDRPGAQHPTPTSVEYYCELREVLCNGTDQWHDHVIGQKHRKRVARLQVGVLSASFTN